MQTSLGIKKDYDKWNDISPKEYQYDLNQTKKSLLWLKDSVDINLLDNLTTGIIDANSIET